MPCDVTPPRSICILRLSAIGDVCHAVATVQAIQARWPEAQITWVIGKIELTLLEGLPGVEFVVFDKRAGLKGYKALRHQLKGRRFDILLHMQVALRASGAAWCIKAREIWGFDQNRAKEGQWLFTNKRIPAQSEPHVADGFLAFAKAIGVAPDTKLQWQMPLADSDIAWQKDYFKDLGNYLVICPAASKAERNWLPERYAAIADYAAAKGFEVVICGGPTQMEKSLAESIVEHCQSSPTNLVGKTSLKQLLVVLKEAQFVLAPDTGPAHMAVTVNTPVLGLYAHSNPKRTGPYRYLDYVVSVYASVIQEQTGLSAEQLPWGKRAKGEDLMARISVAQVIEKLDRLVADFHLTGNPQPKPATIEE